MSVASAALAIAAEWFLLAVIVLVVAGACGPMFTGGLSSQLVHMVPEERTRQRRGQVLDALTYGIAAVLRPFAMGVVAATASPLVAVLTAATAALSGSLILLALPRLRATRGTADGAPPSTRVRRTLLLLFTFGPLRRVTPCAPQ